MPSPTLYFKKMQQEKTLEERMFSHFLTFLEDARIGQVKKSLRQLLVVYLQRELKEGIDLRFYTLLQDLIYLFDLLDSIEEEYGPPEAEKDS